MTVITEKQFLNASLFLIFLLLSRSIKAQSDSIVYNGLVVVEMSDGSNYSPYSDGDDGILRNSTTLLSCSNLADIHNLYLDSSLMFFDINELFIEKYKMSCPYFDIGNLITVCIKNKRLKEKFKYYYLVFEVELLYDRPSLETIMVPNIKNPKGQQFLIKELETAKILRVDSIKPYFQ